MGKLTQQQVKTLVQATPATMRPTFQVRPFSNQRTLENTAPNIKAATHLGHNFSAVNAYQPMPLIVQPKLKLGPVQDKYEEETDQVATQVVQGVNVSATQRQNSRTTVRRRPNIQRMSAATIAATAVTPEVEAGIQAARGGGQPLPVNVRTKMEQAFDASFAAIRIHADDCADRLNRAINARAFTIGHDIFMRWGEYRPQSDGGRRLLAHELTHVMQQGSAQSDSFIQRLTLSKMEQGEIEGDISGTRIQGWKEMNLESELIKNLIKWAKNINQIHAIIMNLPSDRAEALMKVIPNSQTIGAAAKQIKNAITSREKEIEAQEQQLFTENYRKGLGVTTHIPHPFA